MARNNIALYKKIPLIQLEKMIQANDKLQLSYFDNGEEIIIPSKQDENGIVEMDVSDSNYLPSDYDLNISQSFIIRDTSLLFGAAGVTHEDNLIGFGAQIQSSDSNFTYTVSIGELRWESPEDVYTFNYKFNKGEIRGSVNVRFFLYLKEVNEIGKFQAKVVGTTLSEGYFNDLLLMIDGEGALFPITEFNEQDGPLWKLIMDWNEASIDTFDTNHVEIRLNKNHKLYPKLSDTYGLLNRGLMDSILVEAMGCIMHRTFSENNNSEFNDVKDYPENSIATVVSNWASEYDIYPDDKLQSILNKLRSKIDNTKREVR